MTFVRSGDLQAKPKMSTLSIIVATIARPSLEKLLLSIQPQLIEGDEVIVVGDAPEHKARPLVEKFGAPFRYIGYDPPVERGWIEVGQKRMLGIKAAKGQYLNYQDDDDVMAPDALQQIRREIELHPGKLMLFKMKWPNGSLSPSIDSITDTGGASFVFPNDPEVIGWFKPDYGYDDQEFMLSTIEKAMKRAGVRDQRAVVVYARQVITHYSGRGKGK